MSTIKKDKQNMFARETIPNPELPVSEVTIQIKFKLKTTLIIIFYLHDVWDSVYILLLILSWSPMLQP